jgi:hypothetical protein
MTSTLSIIAASIPNWANISGLETIIFCFLLARCLGTSALCFCQSNPTFLDRGRYEELGNQYGAHWAVLFQNGLALNRVPVSKATRAAILDLIARFSNAVERMIAGLEKRNLCGLNDNVALDVYTVDP